MPEATAAQPAPFLCAPGLRIEAQERLSEVRFAAVESQFGRIEAAIERLEKRVWLTIYGVAGAILTEAAMSLIKLTQ